MKKLLSSLLVAGLAASCSFTALAADHTSISSVPAVTLASEDSSISTYQTFYGTWQQSGNRYWFRLTDGTYANNQILTIDDINYGFDEEGWMITGWGQFEGIWFYFNSDGAMQYGWQMIDGKWYYLDANYGNMYVNGFLPVDGTYYLFNNDGSIHTGWYLENDNWYYFDNNGYIAEGWKIINNEWYYFDPDSSIMSSNGWYSIDNIGYYFLPSGAMADGWVLEDNEWYYYPGGKDYTGWLKDSGNWYYISENRMLYNTVAFINNNGELVYGDSDGITYAFDANGVMIKNNWFFDPDYEEWYYLDASGGGHNGWLKDGRNWYYIIDGWMAYGGIGYIDADGNIAEDKSTGIAYALDDNGIMVHDAWYYDSIWEVWGYFDASGAGHNGWLKDGGNWYYCENGIMLQNGFFITDAIYSEFDENGIWLGYNNPPQ